MAREKEQEIEENRVNVVPGIPFSVSPDLNVHLKEYSDKIIVKPVELDIAGVGTGRVQVYKVKIHSTGLVDGVNTPAGPFDIQFESVGGSLVATNNKKDVPD